jgi:hypothetical protein
MREAHPVHLAHREKGMAVRPYCRGVQETLHGSGLAQRLSTCETIQRGSKILPTMSSAAWALRIVLVLHHIFDPLSRCVVK